MANVQGMMTLGDLERALADGEIDTVIVAVCDMQSRLVGKRVRASYFLEHCAIQGVHFCTYLLATDMEMITPDGFTALDWASGYGDYLARPDVATLGRVPWLEGLALLLCDAVNEANGEAIPFSPRKMLK